MREYEQNADPEYRTGVDPDHEHSLDQLWQVIETAANTYQYRDVRGCWGNIRKAFRKLGDRQQTIDGWLGLLPRESQYLSVVCGGLKLIIQVRHLPFSRLLYLDM